MEIKIEIPEEAIDRIADYLKRIARHNAQQSKQQIPIPKTEGLEYITEVLQGVVDNASLNSDPEFIEARKQAKALVENAQKKSVERLKKSK